MRTQEFIVPQTSRALLYEDGKLVETLEPGRYEYPLPGKRLFGARVPGRQVVFVDMRQRELTLKNQEILTADKVSVRVSVLVQFQVTDPRDAVQEVESYTDRLYSDVQLAARRNLATMPLDEILTNRNGLSEAILADVQDEAARYGVRIFRADVKDLIFPGNLQGIMNQVLQAERTAQAKLVEARTRAEVAKLEAETEAHRNRVQAEVAVEATRREAEAEVEVLERRATAAKAYVDHPQLLRLDELETLRALARNANARLYIDFDRKPADGE